VSYRAKSTNITDNDLDGALAANSDEKRCQLYLYHPYQYCYSHESIFSVSVLYDRL